MYFYRRPFWGFGMRILMIVLLFAGIGFVTRTAFMAGSMRGVALEGGEVVAPHFAPHVKGYGIHPMGGSFFTIFAIFLGGILLLNLIKMIVGLVMFNRWKKAAGDDWAKMAPMMGRKFHRGHGGWGHCHPGPWDAYPMEGVPGAEPDGPGVEADQES